MTTVSWNAKLEIWYLGRCSSDDDTFEPVSEGSDDDDEGESSGGADAAGGSGSAGPSE